MHADLLWTISHCMLVVMNVVLSVSCWGSYKIDLILYLGTATIGRQGLSRSLICWNTLWVRFHQKQFCLPMYVWYWTNFTAYLCFLVFCDVNCLYAEFHLNFTYTGQCDWITPVVISNFINSTQKELNFVCSKSTTGKWIYIQQQGAVVAGFNQQCLWNIAFIVVAATRAKMQRNRLKRKILYSLCLLWYSTTSSFARN